MCAREKETDRERQRKKERKTQRDWVINEGPKETILRFSTVRWEW